MEICKITREQALIKWNTEWWLTATPEEIVKFQLFTDRLCMPFDKFHEAVEKCLDRPVWTHEFGRDVDGLRKEFLGERLPPTMREIAYLLTKPKTIVVGV